MEMPLILKNKYILIETSVNPSRLDIGFNIVSEVNDSSSTQYTI